MSLTSLTGWCLGEKIKKWLEVKYREFLEEENFEDCEELQAAFERGYRLAQNVQEFILPECCIPGRVATGSLLSVL